jgi:hypothetical protein
VTGSTSIRFSDDADRAAAVLRQRCERCVHLEGPFSGLPPPRNNPNSPSSCHPSFAQYAGAYAVDGSSTTRWSSVFSDPQWIYVDLGQTYAISEIVLH